MPELQTIEIDQASSILKLLGDKTRLTMLKMLEKNECCVCEFTAVFQATQPAISQHVRKLKDAGLIKENRKGQWIFYSMNEDSAAFPLVKSLLGYIPHQDERIRELERQGLRITCE